MKSTWYRKLIAFGACSDAVEWAKTQPSFASAWKNCKRGDHMLWLLAKIGADHKKIVLVACDCASLALPYTKDARVKACIQTVRLWVRGKATIEQVREARSAAAYAAAYAAADAYAASAAYAAYAAAAAADAYAADDAYAARTEIYARCATIVRKHFDAPSLTRKKNTK